MSGRQGADIYQVPYGGPKHRHYRTKFNRPGDLALEICAPLPYSIV